jgi:hypothetical protein
LSPYFKFRFAANAPVVWGFLYKRSPLQILFLLLAILWPHNSSVR